VATPDFKKSTTDRFNGHGSFLPQARDELPGPGEYYAVEDHARNDGASVLAQNGSAAFGTTSNRFGPVVKATSMSPGPQAYNLQDIPSRVVDESVARRVRNQMPDSVFQSTNVRFPDRVPDEVPDPGAYNPIPAKGKQPRIRPSGEGFYVQSERFKSLSADEDTRDFVTVPSSIGTAGAKFSAGVGRGDNFGKPSGSDMPGPGSYDVPTKWTKKSYNELFKAPESATA
jgi:hypothetical protein